MKKTIEELLTYEIYIKLDYYYLSIPVQNLINPKFSIKNNNLYILLQDNNKGYIIKKLPIYIIKSILNNKCYLKENLSMDLAKEYIISLN